MGAWGVGLYSNDTASDVRENFRDLVAAGLTPEVATERLIADWEASKLNVDDNDFWLGLADTQHRLGHVVPEVVAHALAITEDPAELERWPAELRQRRASTLTKLRA